ncbi:hypothetical protein F7725_020561 [Dissostichus mawsoni]|uniref:Uncharacterized protein n=1 Tax=Dissostichus mawsoni TaxID=36200 RepID=A0A7J5YEI6_DISMA|nr:hypothetical protein F7725_020561 [Dissostichus mawsoni]
MGICGVQCDRAPLVAPGSPQTPEELPLAVRVHLSGNSSRELHWDIPCCHGDVYPDSSPLGVFHLRAEGFLVVELVPEVAVGGALQLTEARQKQAVDRSQDNSMWWSNSGQKVLAATRVHLLSLSGKNESSTVMNEFTPTPAK